MSLCTEDEATHEDIFVLVLAPKCMAWQFAVKPAGGDSTRGHCKLIYPDPQHARRCDDEELMADAARD
jgi:hypothetical protein